MGSASACRPRAWLGSFLVLPAIALALIAGCARYQPRPLTPAIADAGMHTPSLHVLEMAASRIRHPLLPPVSFSGGPLTPDQVAVIAVVANPTLRVARDQFGLAHAQIIQAGILPNPNFSYGLSLPFGNTTGLTRGYSFGLGWDLRGLLLRNVKLAVARAHQRSVALNVAWQEWQVAESAKLHALRVINLEAAVRVAARISDDTERQLAIMRVALAAHDVTLLDEAAAEAAAQSARRSLLSLEGQLAGERLALNQSMGIGSSLRVPLERCWQTPRWRRLPVFRAVLAHLQQRRLDLVALRYGYQSAEEHLRQQVLAQFPRITVTFARARDTTDVNTIGPGVAIELPLFDRNQGAIAIAKATRHRLFDAYRARLFTARAQIRQVLTDMKWLKRRIRRSEAGVRSSLRLVRAAHQGFADGDVNAILYYQVRERLAARRLALLALRRRLNDFGVALEIASGEYFEGEGRAK